MKPKSLYILIAFVIVFSIAFSMLFYSVHIQKPNTTRIQVHTEETFYYELEYYLTQAGFYKLHGFLGEPPAINILFLDTNKTISITNAKETMVLSNTPSKTPDISVYTYSDIVYSFRACESTQDIKNTIKSYIKTNKTVYYIERPWYILALKGYPSINYLAK